MKKYDGILLCSDFDGTVYSHGKKEISRENADAIKYFQENGGRFTLATGRFPNILDEKAEQVRGIRANAPIIAANGALMYDFEEKKVISSAWIDLGARGVINRMLDEIEELSEMLVCRSYIWEAAELVRGEREELTRQLALLPHKIYFVMDIDSNDPTALEKSDELTKKAIDIAAGSYDILRGSLRGLEILPKGASKGACARILKDYLKCDTLVCVGDYENDISMIKEADIGYAMGNAHPSLFDICDRIAPRCEENAIAKIIYEL